MATQVKLETYTIEASNDGVKWTRQASFEKGQPSRWEGKLFDANLAVEEATGFIHARYDDYKFVRIVIS